MITKYLRYSTNYQDVASQNNIIETYCNIKGLITNNVIIDEAVSGGVSYKKRNLNELLHELKSGDTLIVSEISRLSRGGIIELSELIQTFFKPNNLRLIICNVNLDINCTNIDPMVEMQLMMLATFAKIEKQLIQERTRNALDARKKEIETNGYFISKSGLKRTKLGGNGIVSDSTIKASVESRRNKALTNEYNVAFWEFINDYQLIHGKITANTDFTPIADELNKRNKRTATGLEFDSKRARAMYFKTKGLYINQK